MNIPNVLLNLKLMNDYKHSLLEEFLMTPTFLLIFAVKSKPNKIIKLNNKSLFSLNIFSKIIKDTIIEKNGKNIK